MRYKIFEYWHQNNNIIDSAKYNQIICHFAIRCTNIKRYSVSDIYVFWYTFKTKLF